MTQHSKQSSFTIMELLIVIAIIAILAAVVVVSFSDSQRRARESAGLQFSHNIKSSKSTSTVSDWGFDEGSGSTTKDSYNSITGTITNAVWTNGKINKGLNFSANESKVAIPANPIFNPSSEITIEAWIRTNSASRQQIVLEAYGYCCHTDKNFYIESNQLFYYARAIGAGGLAYSATDSSLSSNQWKHVVVTAKTNERPKFYINSVLKDNPDSTQTYSPSGMHSGLGLTIGSTYNGTSEQGFEFQGTIDELRIYKEALSAREVKKHYAESLFKYFAKK